MDIPGFQEWNFCQVAYEDGSLRPDVEKLLHGHHSDDLLLHLLRRNVGGLPDFVCRRDDEVQFVILARESELSEKQRECMDALTGAGFRFILDESPAPEKPEEPSLIEQLDAAKRK